MNTYYHLLGINGFIAVATTTATAQITAITRYDVAGDNEI